MTDKPKKAGRKLTAKQSAFIREYTIDRNGTQAAIRAGYSAKTANEQAARMLAKVNIRDAVIKGEEKHAEQCDVTVADLTKELIADRKLARDIKQPSPAITATMSIAKLHGLDIDRSEVEHSGSLNVVAEVSYAKPAKKT